MKVLGIDTASNVATVAIIDGDKMVCEYSLNHKKTHSQKLMPLISELFAACEMDILDIDVIATSIGPGSFTGLRIGIATAKALAHALDKPLVGVSTLEAMAYNLPYCEHIITPIMDARRSQVYTAIYRWCDASPITLQPPQALAIEELYGILLKYQEKVVFIGDGVAVHKEYLTNVFGKRALFATAACNMQRAASVAVLGALKAQCGDTVSYTQLLPEYLRMSQAEREYAEKTRADIS